MHSAPAPSAQAKVGAAVGAGVAFGAGVTTGAKVGAAVGAGVGARVGGVVYVILGTTTTGGMVTGVIVGGDAKGGIVGSGAGAGADKLTADVLTTNTGSGVGAGVLRITIADVLITIGVGAGVGASVPASSTKAVTFVTTPSSVPNRAVCEPASPLVFAFVMFAAKKLPSPLYPDSTRTFALVEILVFISWMFEQEESAEVSESALEGFEGSKASYTLHGQYVPEAVTLAQSCKPLEDRVAADAIGVTTFVEASRSAKACLVKSGLSGIVASTGAHIVTPPLRAADGV